MNRYVVVQKGIYYQDMFGPFATVERAQIHAQHRAETDIDDYHEYTVLKVTLDGLTDPQGSFRKDGNATWYEAHQEEYRRFPKPIVEVTPDYVEHISRR